MRLPSAARTVLLLTTGITLAMTTAPATAAPTGGSAASAAPIPASCDWGRVCVYNDPGFKGGGTTVPTVPSGRCTGYSSADWQSARNTTNNYVRLWDNSNCTGANKLLGPGYSVSDLGFGAAGVGGL
ncbi:hypothetical protein E1281_34240 [Actinomadura sp. KC345]|nr:hypothetical protein E1281_34240 [Actinomadura sp. KC345]